MPSCTTNGPLSNSFRDDQFLNLKPKNDGYVWRDLKGCVYQYKFHKPIIVKKSSCSTTISHHHNQPTPTQQKKMVQVVTPNPRPRVRPRFILEAVVEYEYKAEQEDELNLKVGDIIKHVQTAEGGWWEGELNGKKGMFPENFVKLVKKRENTKKEEKREAAQRKSVRELANKFKDGVPMGGMAPKKKEKKKYCKVLFEYTKENDDELELGVGDIVEFIKEVEEGWWEGTLNGKHGVFPSNFVEMEDDTVEEPAPPTEDKIAVQSGGDVKDNEVQEIKGKKVTGFGLGNIFSGGPIKLRSTGNSKVDEPVKEPAKETAKPTKPAEPEPAPDVAKRERQTERAVVRYSYAADQPDELELEEGQVVRIIDKELEDEGWWKGEVNGKVGVFPDNFVELLPPEEISKPKKPAPPAASGKQNVHQPKLPEKVPIGDSSDDRIKTDNTSSIKKPPGPPPIGKKPGFQKPPEVLASKPEAVLSTRPASSGKGKENHSDITHDDKDGSFDNIEPAAQKLTHLTANRPKGPPKRPPSTVLIFNEGEKEIKIADEMKTSHVTEKPQPALPAKVKQPSNHVDSSAPHHHVISLQTNRDTHSSTQPPSRPAEPTTAPPAIPSHTASATNTQTTKLLEQLQQDLNELKANTVSKTAFNELRAEHEKLKLEFENTKNGHAKKLRQLMNEVDEEKKLRLSTEVEVERVKKLLAESHV